MPDTESYIREKLRNAVDALATSPRSIQERLEAAAVAFITLSPKDFSDEEGQEAFKRIQDDLTAVKIESPRGYIGETLSRMSDDDASALASRIFDLFTDRMYKLSPDF